MVATTSHIFSGKVDIASNLKVGSSRLFVDTENNRVGINESDPDASLHVTGNAYIETNVGIGSTINLEGATGNVTVSGNVHATGVKVNGINVALDPDLSDNASRISVLETDATSNHNRIVALEELNIDDIRTDMTSNAGRIDDMFTANTVQSGLISAITLDMTSNAGRINDMFAANTVQRNLISAITIDMTSNAGRIDDLLTANTVQRNLISAITIDMTSNAGRIDDLLTANTVQRDLITDITDDMTSNAGRIDLIITDMTSNAGRIDDMFAANTVQSGLITDITLDMTSNSGRIDGLDTRIGNLETANNVQESLINTLITSNADIWSNLADNVTRITVLEDDMASNAGRITNLMTSNVDIWSNLAANVIRITNLETANTVQRDLITDITGDMTSNAGRIDVIISDVLSNALRLNQMFAANTVQGGLITAITTDMTSNAGRIDDLFAANTVQGGLITDITTDMTSNAGRIDDLFTANTVQGGLITDITTDMTSNAGRIDDLFAANTVQGGLITDITTDMTSNAGRIDDLFAANTVQSGLITDITTDMTSNAGRIDDLFTANTVQSDLISAITTDMTSNAARVQYITTVADTTFIASNLEVTGNIFMRGDRFVVESETKLINDAVIGIANNNTLSTTDVGVVMQRPDANVALIHHGSGSGSYPDQFTMGYTQSTLTDGDITTDEANIFTLNVLGNVTAQNNITSTTSTVSNVTTMGTTKTFVVTMSSASGGNKYYIDGYLQASLELHQHQTYIFDLSSSTLSGHPFVFDSSNSNDGTTNSDPYYTTGITSTGVYGSTEKRTFVVPVGAPTTLYYYCNQHSGMGSTMSIASTSELIVSGRVVASGNVEASAFIGDGTKLTGVALSADMTSNVDRIEVLETSNVDIWSNLASNVDRIEALETSNVNIWSNLASNVDRIEALETSNVDIWSNLASNVDRIEALETSNVNIWSNLASNVDRIEALETSNVNIWSNLASNVDRIEALETSNVNIWSNLASNVDRIEALETSNVNIWSNLASNVVRIVALENNGIISNSSGINSIIQGDIVYASADSTLQTLAVGASGEVLKVVGGVPAWATESGGAAGVLVSNSVGITTGFTQGDIIYASADNTLSKLALGSSGQVLKSDGTDVVWGTDGGGGSTVWLTNGNKIHYDADNVGIGTSTPAFKLDVHGTANVGALTATTLSVGGADVALDADMTANAVRVDALYTGTTGQLIYGTGTDTLGKLDIGTTGHVLKVAGGVPKWEAESGGGGGGGQWTGTSEIYFEGNVGISNTDPDHDLSVGSNLFIDDDGSNVLVISGNAAMSSLTLGQVSIVASYGLDDILSTSNISSNTMRLTNATTGLVTTGNVSVGNDLTVTGDMTAGYLYGDVSNVTGITSNLHQIAENGNVTSNTLQFTNATTGFVTTANVEVGGELTVSSNLTVTGNATVSSNLTVTGNATVSSNLTVTGNVLVSDDLTVTGNVADLNIVSNVNMLHTSNTASIKLNSNVVTEFPRSKKLIKYPRVALTGGQSGLSGGYTQDGYVVQASSESAPIHATSNVFNNIIAAQGVDHAWVSSNSSYGTDGLATSGTSKDTFETIDGSWVGIKLPVKIKLEYINLHNRYNTSSVTNDPKNGIIWATNDGTNWTRIYDFSNLSDTLAGLSVISVHSQNHYNEFRIQITEMYPNTTNPGVAIQELEYYGIPEYDPEAHGVDVVVKSVPNVPNTDWLEVYYDAKNYTSGAVQDLSTNSFNGTLTNGATFDNSDGISKFAFDAGTNQYMTTTTDISGSAFIHTTSMWVKFVEVSTDSGQQHYLFMLGAFGSNSIGMYYSANQGIRVSPSGFDYRSQYHPVAGKWFHVSYTYAGGAHGTAAMNTTVKFYINGKQWNIPAYYGSTSTVTLPSSSVLQINGSAGNNNTLMDMEVGNFRIFNRALTSDEIYQLYAYQKQDFGHGTLGMTLKAGRLGIGTSEPRAALDVRGDVHFHNVPHMYAIDSGGYDGANGAYVNFDTVLESYEISLEGSDGTFRITESAGAGIYAVRGSVAFHESNGTESRNLNIYIHVNNTQINARGYPLTAMKHVTGSTYADLGVSALARCNVGDTIRLYATSGSSSINVHTPNNTMIIYKIQSI